MRFLESGLGRMAELWKVYKNVNGLVVAVLLPLGPSTWWNFSVLWWQLSDSQPGLLTQQASTSPDNPNQSSIFSFSLFFLLFFRPIDSDKRQVKKIVARAGTNVTLPCTGAFGEKAVPKIDKLTWKLSGQTIIKFINGRPLEQNQRVSTRNPIRSHFGSIFCFSLLCCCRNPFFASLQRSLLPNVYSLQLHPAKLTDSGEYVCVINETPSEPIDLLMQDIAEPPTRPMVTAFTSRAVNLSWSQAQDPKNLPVADFIVEARWVENGGTKKSVQHHYFGHSPGNKSRIKAPREEKKMSSVEKVLLQFIIYPG